MINTIKYCSVAITGTESWLVKLPVSGIPITCVRSSKNLQRLNDLSSDIVLWCCELIYFKTLVLWS